MKQYYFLGIESFVVLEPKKNQHQCWREESHQEKIQHTLSGTHSLPTAKSIKSRIHSSSSFFESNFRILPTILPSFFNPKRLSKNSRSAAIAW